MKMKKSFFAVLLSIVFMFSSFVPSINVYASNDSNNVVDYTWDTISKYIQRSTGFILDNWRNGVNYLRDFFNSHKSDYNTDDSFDDFLRNNIYDNGSETTFSPDVINLFRDCTVNYINNETGFIYVYSTPASAFINGINSQIQYHAFIDVLNSNDDKICLSYNGAPYIWVSEYPCELVSNGYVYGTLQNTATYYNWQNANYYKYTWNSSSSTYIKSDSFDNPGNQKVVRLSPSQTTQVFYMPICSVQTKQMKMYRNVDSMRAGTEGLQQYYVTDSYNTSHVDNSITYSNESISNQISYSDISNYVNSYYINNQTYPSSQDTYNYINNYNGSGGGSGGGPDDDDDDDGWDWGFLDTIADFLKGLLKALKTAVEGVLDVLTGVIDLFIGEEQPDGTRSGGLPNIVARLVAYFLPFLPDWCTSLIGFSVLLALILGVIKLVRGH